MIRISQSFKDLIFRGAISSGDETYGMSPCGDVQTYRTGLDSLEGKLFLSKRDTEIQGRKRDKFMEYVQAEMYRPTGQG